MHPSDHDIRNRLLIARLPAMPQILIKLIELLQADDAGLPELAALISNDAAMTAKILAVANSSAYHRSGRSAGIEQSLAALGTDMIKTLVISESVFQAFNGFPHSGSTDLRRFWKTSLSAAVIARDLAKKMEYAHVEQAYLAGLLHNVGRLALLAAAPREYAHNFMARDDDSLCAIEQRTLQITHSEAGAWLIERWQLDSLLADAVLYHHEPVARLATAHPLIRIVRLAHLLVSHPCEPVSVADAASLCGLDAQAIEAITLGAVRQVQKAAAALDIDLAGADDVAAPPALAPHAPDPVQQRLSEHVSTLVQVAQVAQNFARHQDESGLLESVTRSARILFDFDDTMVLLGDPSGQVLIGTAAGDGQQRLAELSIPLAHGGLIADAALERRLAFITRDAQAPGLAEEQLFRMLGSDSLVCLPLVAGLRCLGILIGGIAPWRVPSCQRRSHFLQAFGAQVASALEAASCGGANARRQLANVAEEYREASRRVAHEVNNPLSIIKNYLTILDAKLARGEAVVGEMSILNEEIDRVCELINGLADLQPTGGACATDVTKVVADVLRLFRATSFVPANVDIVLHCLAEPAEIEADANIVKQILVNLIKNAVEAMPGGGKVEITNNGQETREHKLYLKLVISDTGPGLPADALAAPFSAARSTKDGTHHGLGLAIVESLVKKIHGLITCRSGSSGTTFDILLPVGSGADASADLAPARG